MKSYSTVAPPFLVESGGVLYVNCNVSTVSVDVGEPTQRTEYVYDTVPVHSKERGVLISAVMQAKYTKDQELAILNAHLLGTKPGEWAEYQAYRTLSKAYVDSNLFA